MTRPSVVTPELHSAGATVLHRSPFDDLEVPISADPLDPGIRDRWVKPFYMAVPDNLISIEAALRPLLPEVSPELINALLTQFNWRPRVLGAFFVALDRRNDFQDFIGRLLLRSDVCYAGRSYCIALACLNTPTAVDFLQRYLRYYLTRNDLWFDQAVAMAALRYLDEVNGTAHFGGFDELWRDFVSNKPNWNLAQTCSRFDATLRGLESFRAGG
jgi:hypothetical protein